MLPAVDPDELERALAELHKPFIMANQGGYDLPYPMSRERAIQSDGRLTDLQLKLLRQTLLKLNCSVTVYTDLNYGVPAYGPTVPVHRDVITISGRLPIGIGAKEGTSRCARDIPEHLADPCSACPSYFKPLSRPLLGGTQQTQRGFAPLHAPLSFPRSLSS
jgi:hypothetical protein